MEISKEIVEKMEKVNVLQKEIAEYLYENFDASLFDGSDLEMLDDIGGFKYEGRYDLTDTPKGEKQRGGCYVEQHQDGWIEDAFYGFVSIPTEKGNYLTFDFHV